MGTTPPIQEAVRALLDAAPAGDTPDADDASDAVRAAGTGDILGHKAYKSVMDVPGVPDVAISAIPSKPVAAARGLSGPPRTDEPTIMPGLEDPRTHAPVPGHGRTIVVSHRTTEKPVEALGAKHQWARAAGLLTGADDRETWGGRFMT
ncbi:hypothetical protein [Streptomyces liangshanensis]|uniref:hypothetical protein n=1 Tax=Streptomyces liangshanensis TaxID=2717324 RepID=UPI0036DC7E36